MSLSGLNSYFVPLSLDGLDAFTQSVQDNALLLDGSNAMLADIDCGTHAVKNMADAVTNDEAVNLGQLNTSLGGYVTLGTTQTITGAKSFSQQVVFSGATKTNLVATDIPNAGTRTWLDSSGSQNIVGSKSWANSQTWNGPNANFNGTAFTVSATTTTTLGNGASCGNKKLTSVLDPTAAQDAATKNYVDTADALKVSKSGDALTGSLSMGGNRITNLANGTAGTDAVTLNQLTSAAYIDTVQTVTSSTFTIDDNTATITLCNFNGGLISLPATGVSSGKVLRFINVYNSSNSVTFWSNVGAGSIDGVTGSQQQVELRYMQSVTFVARGSGAYSTVAIDLLPPHARVKADYGSNDISFYTWDGNVLNITAKRLQLGSTEARAYVPVVRTAWTGGELVRTRVYNYGYGGSGIMTLTAGQFGYWKNVNYTVENPTVSDSTLTLQIDQPYHCSGSGQDNMIVHVEDITAGTAQTIMRKSQYYDNSGGGGTRSSPLFPLVGSYTPANALTTAGRNIRVTVINNTNDTLYLCAYVNGSGVITAQDTWSMIVSEYKNY